MMLVVMILMKVFSSWAQFRLTLHYLATMEQDQTLTMYSGHPMGLFPSSPSSPRLIITNGMVIPNYSSREDYDRMFALGQFLVSVGSSSTVTTVMSTVQV